MKRCSERYLRKSSSESKKILSRDDLYKIVPDKAKEIDRIVEKAKKFLIP